MNLHNLPGPGDEATWPPYSGHPNDPRALDADEAAIQARADQLLRAADFNPHTAENFIEAISQAEEGDLDDALKQMAAGDFAAAGKGLNALALDYWRPLAERDAEKQIAAESGDDE